MALEAEVVLWANRVPAEGVWLFVTDMACVWDVSHIGTKHRVYSSKHILKKWEGVTQAGASVCFGKFK